jgi:hypothetical protein
MTSFSIRETETLVLKASRGAYMTWGLAEEAARAVGWMVANGLPGLEAVADLLETNDGKSCRDLGPADVEGIWRCPEEEALCPIVTGALLSDSVQLLAADQVLHLGPLAHPALLLPFAADLAEARGESVALRWRGFEAVCSGRGVVVSQGGDKLSESSVESVSIAPAGARTAITATTQNRVEMTDDVHERLKNFAYRTYLPESEESRLSGAGGGTVDDD